MISHRTWDGAKDDALLASSSLPFEASISSFRGIKHASLFWSTNIACLPGISTASAWNTGQRLTYRCEKVPRPTSWPDMRTSYPSDMSEPKAIASAVAKSTLPSSDFSRLLICRFNLEWTFYTVHQSHLPGVAPREDSHTKESGSVTLAVAALISSSRLTPVSGWCSAAGPFGQTQSDHLPSSIWELAL